MCGIYGSNGKYGFNHIQNINLSRGSHSTGVLTLHTDGFSITKCKEYEASYEETGHYYLGHNRAPTTTEEGKGLKGCHPFICGRAIVAHNGIISNTGCLENEYKRKYPVDSQWISFLYDYWSNRNNTPESAMRLTLLEIEGTFGIWLYDIDTNKTFVARGDNTIYWDPIMESFSSTPTATQVNLMPEGAIYRRNGEELSFTDINADNRLNRRQKYFII